MIVEYRNFTAKIWLNRAIFAPDAYFIIKNKLILDSTNTPHDRRGQKRGVSTIKVSFVILLLGAVSLAVFIFPSSEKAHAGVFSFISNVFNGAEAKGDISSKYNSQNIAILEAPLSAKLAVADTAITIVDSSALAYETESPEGSQSDQISTYIVREGDTLSQIAEMFKVSVNTIIWANDIKNGVISPGDDLTILPITGVRHEVVAGETIQGIVKKHGGDLNEVLQFNGLESDAKLAVGDIVIVPNGESTVAVKNNPSTKPGAVNTAGYFAKPMKSYTKTQGIHGHNGVDLAAPVGTTIMAAAGGKVIVSKNNGAYNGGYGNYVVISHPNGTQTLYAHMRETTVSVGQNVNQGDKIGSVGSTGKSTGNHLHIEVRGGKNPF